MSFRVQGYTFSTSIVKAAEYGLIKAATLWHSTFDCLRFLSGINRCAIITVSRPVSSRFLEVSLQFKKRCPILSLHVGPGGIHPESGLLLSVPVSDPRTRNGARGSRAAGAGGERKPLLGWKVDGRSLQRRNVVFRRKGGVALRNAQISQSTKSCICFFFWWE